MPPTQMTAPKMCTASATAVDMRARRIPSSWIDGVARLDRHRPLTDIAPHRWRQFLSDCNNFLTGGENWAGRAAELGWNAASLFGCRRARSFAHPGGAGLLWAIQGGRLVRTTSRLGSHRTGCERIAARL